MLQGPVVVDTMELVCGQNYTEQQAETICRAGWAVDAVHPTAHTFAKMALNLMERYTRLRIILAPILNFVLFHC
jgi:hypothetical protein